MDETPLGGIHNYEEGVDGPEPPIVIEELRKINECNKKFYEDNEEEVDKNQINRENIKEGPKEEKRVLVNYKVSGKVFWEGSLLMTKEEFDRIKESIKGKDSGAYMLLENLARNSEFSEENGIYGDPKIEELDLRKAERCASNLI